MDFPDELTAQMLKEPEHAREIEEKWAIKQCHELLDFGAPSLYFYIMNGLETISKVENRFR